MKKEYDFKNAKRGAVIPQNGKTRVTIYLDNGILKLFRKRADKARIGYQTMINEALKEYLSKSSDTVDEATLRRVIREELKEVS